MPNKTFLSHSSRDKDAVRVIADGLTNRGIDVWFDENDIRSSDSFVEEIGHGLREASSIVVFIGPLGETDGKWHRKEINLAVQRNVNNNVPLHVFLLPGLDQSYELPDALTDVSCLRFSDQESHGDTLNRLAEAIRANDPHGLGRPVSPARSASWSNADERAFRECLLEFRSANATFFLGALCWENTRLLINDLLLDLLEQASFLAPGTLTWKSSDRERVIPPLEAAAAYYALRHSQTLAAERVSDLVRQHTRQFPEAADRFALLVAHLAAHRPRPSNQAVVTTNFDLTVERSFLRQGLDFSRVIQNLPEGALIVELYRCVSRVDHVCTYRKLSVHAPDDATGKAVEFNRTDLNAIDGLLASSDGREYFYLQPGKRQAPVSDCVLPITLPTILYKFAGSVDVDKSCLASADLHYDCLSSLGLTPDGIQEAVEQNVPVVLGFGPTGGDFRLLRHAVLHRCRRPKRFAFIPDPDNNCVSEFVTSQIGSNMNLDEAFTGYSVVQADIHRVLQELEARLRLQTR